MDWDVIITGAGPGGLAAAIWCRRLGLRTLVLEKAARPGGQVLEIAQPIRDYPGIPATDGPSLAAALAGQAREAGAEILVHTAALAVETAADVLRVSAESGTFTARRLIVATGARPRLLGVPGEAEMIQRGEVWRGSRDAMRFAGKEVAVVGGGDRALQNALMLAEAGAAVTLIHRSARFRARREFLAAAADHPRVRILAGTVTRILGAGRVEAVEVAPLPQAAARVATLTLPVAAVFIYIGMEPVSDLVRGWAELEGEGLVKTDVAGRTAASGIFAVGDVRTPPEFRSIVTAAGQGMTAAKAVALDLDGRAATERTGHPL